MIQGRLQEQFDGVAGCYRFSSDGVFRHKSKGGPKTIPTAVANTIITATTEALTFPSVFPTRVTAPQPSTF